MKRKPSILITASAHRKGVEFADASLSLSQCYPRAVAAAGGLPWVVPGEPVDGLVGEWVRRVDGVMLTGGDDVQPGLYGARPGGALARTVAGVDAARDLFECLVIREAFRQGKPLLAICRGQQILNVALGGTLLIDIRRQVPAAINHQRADRKDEVVHEVTLTPDSLLASIAGGRKLGVNSSHHQAVERVAKPLSPSAVSPDGVIEGLELHPLERDRLPFLLAVQFHPERMFERHGEFLQLFRAFVGACAVRRK